MSFEREKEQCAERLQQAGKGRLVATAVVGALGVAAGAGSASVWPVVGGAVFAAGTWFAMARRSHEVGTLLEPAPAPDLWFLSPRAGLVFFDDRGVFVEREGELITWVPKTTKHLSLEGMDDTRERRLASISYEEGRHAFKLQFLNARGTGAERTETHSAIELSLPAEVTPERALQIAVLANRKSAQSLRLISAGLRGWHDRTSCRAAG